MATIHAIVVLEAVALLFMLLAFWVCYSESQWYGNLRQWWLGLFKEQMPVT